MKTNELGKQAKEIDKNIKPISLIDEIDKFRILQSFDESDEDFKARLNRLHGLLK